MKKTLYIIGLLYCMLLSQTVAGQDETRLLALANIEQQKVSVNELLLHLKGLEGIQLSYSEENIPNREIEIPASNMTVQDLLTLLAEKGGLTIHRVGKNIILKPIKEEKYTVSGFVFDEANGEAMIGATIQIKGTQNGVISNVYGFYSLTLDQGTYVLIVSSVGFEPQEITVDLSKDQTIDVRIKSEAQQLEEVVITAKEVDANVTSNQMGYAQLSSKSIKNVPALMGEVDVIRAIRLLPGVQMTSETSSGFSVRGGSPDQNLILLDEAVVYNPSHLFGFFSTFNNDAVKNVEFYKGNMPVRYGGRLSSLLDIRMKEGNNQRFTLNGGISPISARLTLETPIVKDKGSIIISGRRTYADLLARSTSNKESVDNTTLFFYDLNMKANYTIDENNRIFLSSYAGRDVLSFESPGGDFTTDFRWGNLTTTARWNHVFNKRLFSNTSLIFSDYNYTLGFGAQDFRFDWDSNLRDYTAKIDFDYFLNTKNTISVGASSTLHRFDPGKVKVSGSGENGETRISRSNALEHAIYLGNEHRISNKLQLAYGGRLGIFQNIGEGVHYTFDSEFERTDSTFYKKGEIYNTYTQFEPRMSATYQLSQTSSIKASYARTTQFLHLASNSISGTPLDIWFPSSPNVKPQLADQISGGYFRNFFNNKLEVSVETYYKWLNRQIDFKDHAELLLNEELEGELRVGKAKAYGLELMVKKPEGKLNGWVSFTWSKSERQIDAINNGKAYRSSYDRPINISAVGNYTFNKRVSLSANWVYFDGLPFTTPSGRMYYGNSIVPTYTERNGDRVPSYHRLDLGLTIEQKKNEGRRWKGSWVFSVYNAYGRKNANFISFRTKEGTNETEAIRYTIFRWVPSIAYNFKF
ncbi:MAG: TonB-dependent receptor [Cyclobacteriaceae bacterium]